MLKKWCAQQAHLDLEGLWLLPGEILVGEVAVLGGLVVDWLDEVKLLDDDTRSKVEVLVDDLNKLFRGLVRRAVGLNEDGQWLGDANGVRELHKGTASETSLEQGLSNPASEVCGGSVDLGVVLARESTTTVCTPTAVGVDDNLTAGQTSVTLWATDDEEAGWLDLQESACEGAHGCHVDLRGTWSSRQGTWLG